ncbi:MAG TPA: FtsX-like permease family protein [Hyphomicrobiaceae bacterium]|nr:FtsX-like permease family protein [Hyphomicrobiaceae bacterium]
MAPKLAYRNLFHDRMSLTVTLVGILFSVVLVAIQCGLYLGSEQKIATVLDRVNPDLWIVSIGTKSFDDPSLLTGSEKYALLSTPGVQRVEEMVVSFAAWRKPQGGKKAFVLIGLDWLNGGLEPWNLIEGSVAALATPDAVAVDRSYFRDLGIDANGAHAEINGKRVQVAAVTQGIRSFTTLPYTFTTIDRARGLIGAGPRQSTYELVTITPGSDLEAVRQRIAERLPDTEVLTHDEFRKRSVNYWLFNTGAGGALIAGACLGIIVGVVIVAQTLYASTKDHLNEFATLRALGASASYIHAVILIQALLSAVLGYILGISLAMLVIRATRKTTLTIVMTPKLAAYLLALTVGMCIFAAISAIFKVTRIDPAGVFSR